MNKEILIANLALKAKISKSQAKRILKIILDEIGSSLEREESVTITGFGTFSVTKRQAREGVNPRTQQRIRIESAKVPKFKAGKALKKLVE
jgi:DNA-binding protein HU-beta